MAQYAVISQGGVITSDGVEGRMVKACIKPTEQYCEHHTYFVPEIKTLNEVLGVAASSMEEEIDPEAEYQDAGNHENLTYITPN